MRSTTLRIEEGSFIAEGVQSRGGVARERSARRSTRLRPAGAGRLFELDPDLARHLTPDQQARLRRHVLVDLRSLSRGPWRPQDEDLGSADLFGLLVLEGILARRVSVGRRASAELLGAGDLIRPAQPDADTYAVVAQQASWSVLAPARVAVLDGDLISGVAGIPGVLPELAARALHRSRTLSLRLAIVQAPRLADRVHLLLWHLADRWGRRERHAVSVGVRLPQDLLAELVSAQRTSVSAALAELVERGLIEDHDGTWALRGDPPGDLLIRP